MGRSVRLFLADGSATGVLTAEIINWTGHVVAGPRTRLDAALKREELQRTGIYLIFGEVAGSDLPHVYVGEGDSIASRLYSHSNDDKKDFWERFVGVTSKDLNLTKAHVKYLESRLISLLKEAKKSVLINKTAPGFDKLPEADISDMETFLDELRLILPVIGVDLLKKPVTRKPDQTLPNPNFHLIHTKKGIKAQAVEADGEFVVLAGSRGSLNESVSFDDAKQAFRNQVFESGRARKISDQTFETVDDIAFKSPSAASVFLFGTSRNGRTDWLLDASGKSYGEWKDEGLKSASEEKHS